MTMISMKLDKKAAQEETAPSPGEAPLYPYGLCLSLSNDVLQKLGMTTPPAVGTKMTLTALVEVTSTSAYKEQDGAEISANLQITDMELSSAPSSLDDRAAQKFYGS